MDCVYDFVYEVFVYLLRVFLSGFEVLKGEEQIVASHQFVVHYIIFFDLLDILQQIQYIWDYAVDVHEGQDRLSRHHPAHMVAVEPRLLDQRQHQKQLIFAYLL